MYTLLQYTPEMAARWDAAVDNSRNGTFLLRRAYMDYHADRFTDRSLLVADARSDIVAVFAAAELPGLPSVVAAHPGLTYGGLLPAMNLGASAVVDITGMIADRYRTLGYRRLDVAPVPYIYHRRPADDVIYALWRHGATMSACLLGAAMQPADRLQPDTNTRRNIARGRRDDITVVEDTDIDAFHAMLAQNLAERHNGAVAVHTAAELKLLAGRFPDNIRLVTARDGADGRLLAGVILYITDTCTHTQYIASTSEGRERRALAYLLDSLIRHAARPWLDFGTSNEQGGAVLNPGLIRQKYGFGARGVAYQRFSLELFTPKRSATTIS